MTEDRRIAGGKAQLRLPLERPPVFSRELFVVSACNREAVAAVDSWPDWPSGCLVLVGPEGVGKSHLARSWATHAGAVVVSSAPVDLFDLPNGPVLLEDVDRLAADTALFHLINRAGAGASLLMTARAPPRAWPCALADLRSRLNALLAVRMEAPDDVVLEGVLLKLFRDRNIRPDRELLSYLLRRIERSAPAALAIVARLDEAADALGRGITRALAREVLESDDPERDLFE